MEFGVEDYKITLNDMMMGVKRCWGITGEVF